MFEYIYIQQVYICTCTFSFILLGGTVFVLMCHQLLIGGKKDAFFWYWVDKVHPPTKLLYPKTPHCNGGENYCLCTCCTCDTHWCLLWDGFHRKNCKKWSAMDWSSTKAWPVFLQKSHFSTWLEGVGSLQLFSCIWWAIEPWIRMQHFEHS